MIVGKILSKIRFLPLTIFMASMMLTVKVGDIWDGVDGLVYGSIAFTDAKAQQPKQGETSAEGAAEKEAAPNEDGEEKAGDEGETGDNAQGDETASTGLDDPTLLTQAEIDLLQQLAERREELDARQKELEIQNGLLQAAETRIDRKVVELKDLQTTIERLLKTYEDQQNAKLQSLVKIYENMKPKDAARIFEELDMDTLLLVAESMKERKLADVMSKMNAGKAKDMTVELSRLRNLPEPGK